jgi:hypothetical protein
MRNMQLAAEGYAPGAITFLAISERKTVFLRFAVDFANGQIHTMLEEGGVSEQFNAVTEAEVEHYTRYFHSVVANRLVELCIDGIDPVPCEVVIPVNIIPQIPEEMVAKALEQFRKLKAQAQGPAAPASAAPEAAAPSPPTTQPAESPEDERRQND